MAIPVQRRADTAANWTSVNPILIERQQGFETDTLKWKLGDGVTAWNSLPYFSGGSGTGDMVLADVQIVTGKKTFGSAGAVGKLAVAGTTSGSTIIDATAVAGSGTVTLPTTGTLATLAGAESLSNKTLVAPALGTPASGTLTNCTGLPVSTGVSGLAANVAAFLATPSSANLAAALTDETGTGANVFANSPTLVTPTLGTPSAVVLTNATGLPLTTGVTGILPHGNLGTGGGGSTKFLREDSTYQTISGGGDALVANPLSQFAATTSAQLAGVISDETGTGALVFANTPTLVTPILGVATATTVNKVALTAPATGSTLTIADGQTLTVNGSSTITNGTHSGTNTGDQSLFGTIAVSGQSDVVADTANDTLTLVAGSNVTITTNAGTDTITIAASGGGGNSFETIAVSGQSNVVADSSTDTLTLVAGTNVTITTNATTDEITINSSQTNITGNAGTATALQTGRTINGTTFDGTANITVTAAAGTLTGSTLASGVTASSLTSVGTITSGTWNGTQMAVFYGGTGAGTFTDGGVLIGNGTSAIQATSAGTAGQVLISGGAGVDPTFGAVPSHNHAASDITSGTIATARLGSGTANSSTYLRGDQTWQPVSGSGDVVGPASATDAVPALFDGTTGKLLKNSTPTGTGNPVMHNGPTFEVPHADSWILDGSISGTSVLEAHPSSGTTTYFIFPATTGNAGQALTTDGTGQTSWSSTPTLGAASGTTGAVLFKGTTSGTVTFTVAAAAGTHTVKLPTSDGSANQVLQTDGSGQWVWADNTTIATDTIWNASGDLVVGTGSNTASILAPPSNFGSRLIYGPSGVEWIHPTTHFYLHDDFEISFSQPSRYGSFSSGGTIGPSNTTSTDPYWGIIELGTGTGTTGYRVIMVGDRYDLLGLGRTLFEARIKLPTLSDATNTYTAYIGFIDHQSSMQDAVWFEYSHGVNSGNWQCKVSENGSATTHNTSTAADTSWRTFKIDVNASGTQVDFYIDGSNVRTETSANIPNSTNRQTAPGWSIVKSAGTTARTILADYVIVYLKYT